MWKPCYTLFLFLENKFLWLCNTIFTIFVSYVRLRFFLLYHVPYSYIYAYIHKHILYPCYLIRVYIVYRRTNNIVHVPECLVKSCSCHLHSSDTHSFHFVNDDDIALIVRTWTINSLFILSPSKIYPTCLSKLKPETTSVIMIIIRWSVFIRFTGSLWLCLLQNYVKE